MKRFSIASVAAACVVLGACSHDFHLVDQDAGGDAAPIDAGIDAPPDGPPGPVQLTGGLGTETLSVTGAGLAVFGGFSAGSAGCPATGLCVQGGIHP